VRPGARHPRVSHAPSDSSSSLMGLKRIRIAVRSRDSCRRRDAECRANRKVMNLAWKISWTVGLHELAQGLPVGVAGNRLQAGKLQRLAVLDPELQERPRKLFQEVYQFLIPARRLGARRPQTPQRLQ